MTEPEPLAVVELYLRAGADRQWAFVHGTTAVPVAPVSLSIVSDDGLRMALRPAASGSAECGSPMYADSVEVAGTCYVTDRLDVPPFALVRAGHSYTLEGTLADGSGVRGTTAVPGPFALVAPGGLRERSSCLLPPDTTFELEWTRSEGAWAYLADTDLFNLDALLDSLDVAVPRPLPLRGLSVGATDTTIVFPREFGLFDRFGDASPVLVALQNGLPAGAAARIGVAALDRNATDWLRGGNFNPSGQVRIPSVFGTGVTGVFGAVVVLDVSLNVQEGPPEAAACLP